MVLFWIMIVSKFFFIQVLNNDVYRSACRIQSRDTVHVAPRRGNFFDRNQNLLTSNITMSNIGVNTNLFKKGSEYPKFLARYLPNSGLQIKNAISSNRGIVWVARDTVISREFLDSLKHFPSAVLDKRTKRNYHPGITSGPLLGYISGNDGVSGLEEALDNFLSGRPGWRLIEKDGRGKKRPLLNHPGKRAINGNNVRLTIDQNFQTILYEELKSVYSEYNADNAKGIIINPNTGEILAMASCPSFDPNNRRNIKPASLKNRVISDIYEPGSTFKVVTATSALEKNAVNPEDTIHCQEGKITIQGRTIHDHEEYPAMTFREVIQHSSNVGSILAAQKAGKEQLFRYTTLFGFGNKTDIALDNEEEGIIPPFHRWTDLRAAQIAMGHGLSCTVLQLAYAYGAIANGGKLMKPYIVDEIRTDRNELIQKNEPRVRRVVASNETMETLRTILRDVVDGGTGIKADIQGMSIAGKTGTAQKVTENGYSNSEYVASFASFFPASDPKLVTIIVVDNPKGAIYYGGYVAAPAVRNVIKRIVNVSNDLFFEDQKHQYANLFQKIMPEKDSDTSEQNKEMDSPEKINLSKPDRIRSLEINQESEVFEMPDVIGFPASRAIGALQRMGLKVKIKGSGEVVDQYPHKGQKVKPGNTCILKLHS